LVGSAQKGVGAWLSAKLPRGKKRSIVKTSEADGNFILNPVLWVYENNIYIHDIKSISVNT
jgi:hypothetical protein